MLTSLGLLLVGILCYAAGEKIQAKCVIQANSGTGPIQGTIRFEQDINGGSTSITGSVSGFVGGSSGTKHGFHVHAVGSLGNSCSDATGHYNPLGKNHGAKDDVERHVGDLGNIVENANGVADISMDDSLVSLVGDYTVIKRSIVVHAGEDDLGLGGNAGSITTGNAGPRLGCCIIEEVGGEDSEAECLVETSTGDPSEAIMGTVTFIQRSYGGETTIAYDISGFDTADADTMHGFHVHAVGELGNNCADAKGHFNPTGQNHSGPSNPSRHYGDMGNIMEDAAGLSEGSMSLDLISLRDDNSVIGKSIVIHERDDDLGLGGHDDSLTTGHAGARLGCCIIVSKSGASDVTSNMVPTLFLLFGALLFNLSSS